jgi:hypothetical protein
MKITKKRLRKIIREERSKLLREQGAAMSASEFWEKIEWGEWPGRPPSFEWDYVETEGPENVRFDWRGGSMWYRAADRSLDRGGEVEGQIPKHLVPHLKGMGLEVYT